MKLLLILTSDEVYNIIARYVKPLGFEIIRYRHVLKAMDNIDEIDPTAIAISAKDFPRHWKILIRFVRDERSKEECPIVLFKGKEFSMEEGAQALFLGASGLVDEALESPAELNRLQSILSRYAPVSERRKHDRLYIEDWHRLGFLFVNPVSRAIITGELKSISLGGLSFLPEFSSMLQDIFVDTRLDECSLRAGDAILSPSCRLVRTGRMASMEFVSFPDGEQEMLKQYLSELPLLGYKMTTGPEGPVVPH
ncbi:MAG: PilZ domain-containing protein [Treponema sp.]|jgi:DNA-binding response OmpR family regulator|nr:PilZ domain-containing protein [Treponema sp.]